MLLNRRTLDGIAAGEIDLAFRRWKRPTVRTGGTLHTSAGLLGIDAVEPVAQRQIDRKQARRAGFSSRRELIESLRPEGRLFRIRLHRIGDDPRVELRARAPITKSERAELEARLGRMDRARGEPWTERILELIRDRPETLAADLAALIGEGPLQAGRPEAQRARADREPPGRIPALAAGPGLPPRIGK